MSDCFIAIYEGEVRCAVVADDPKLTAPALADWQADRRVSEIVRVPVEIVRAYLFQKWPGREAAMANVILFEKEKGRRPTAPSGRQGGEDGT